MSIEDITHQLATADERFNEGTAIIAQTEESRTAIDEFAGIGLVARQQVADLLHVTKRHITAVQEATNDAAEKCKEAAGILIETTRGSGNGMVSVPQFVARSTVGILDGHADSGVQAGFNAWQEGIDEAETALAMLAGALEKMNNGSIEVKKLFGTVMQAGPYLHQKVEEYRETIGAQQV